MSFYLPDFDTAGSWSTTQRLYGWGALVPSVRPYSFIAIIVWGLMYNTDKFFDYFGSCTARRSYEGKGIGLASLRGIVGRHAR